MLARWTLRKKETNGFNLYDGIKALQGLRFADNFLIFATSRDDTIQLFDRFGKSLGQEDSKLNMSKTTQTQPGRFLQTNNEVTVEVLYGRSAVITNGLHAHLKLLRAKIRAWCGRPTRQCPTGFQCNSRGNNLSHGKLTAR